MKRPDGNHATPGRLARPLVEAGYFVLRWRGNGNYPLPYLEVGSCMAPVSRADLQALIDAYPDGAE